MTKTIYVYDGFVRECVTYIREEQEIKAITIEEKIQQLREDLEKEDMLFN